MCSRETTMTSIRMLRNCQKAEMMTWQVAGLQHLKRHTAALSQVGRHGVCRVAHQGDTPRAERPSWL